MIAKELIQKIINEAINAPSGDNSQPWRFEVHGEVIDIYNLKERDATLFNFRSRGDFLAHGALIENMVIVAKHFGYETEVVVFPEVGKKEHTARIRLVKTEERGGDLFDAIRKRVTNRKPYKKHVLTTEEKSRIFDVQEGDVVVRLADERKDVARLATAVSLNERLLLENKHIHDFLFSIIRWSDEEEKDKPGMHIKTLELAPPQRLAFKQFKNWRLVEKVNKLGVAKFIAKENAKMYASSSAIGAVAMKGDASEDFVQAGRVLERLWLSLTDMGLSLQPVTAVAYLAQRIKEGEAGEVSQEHQQLVQEADKEIRDTLGLNDETIAMVFRIGKANEPSARSVKLAADITWKD